MHQDGKFSAAARNSGVQENSTGVCMEYILEKEKVGFFFSFFLLGCLGFVLVLVTWRVGRRTALQRALKFSCYPLYACLQLRS